MPGECLEIFVSTLDVGLACIVFTEPEPNEPEGKEAPDGAPFPAVPRPNDPRLPDPTLT